MPRNHNAGPSTLRNRNRVTNKTRLRVIAEAIDADPIVLDEDEEKARVVSTAGVDAEDANEHHLQAVLSAAATRHQQSRSTRAGADREKAALVAYIPTPDSTGLVDNYEELYLPGKWTDPATYVKSSDTVEEAISFALANGFIYYMDERDKEWLDKNNEEARGEGTSAQGAVSGTSTRSGRSAKAKGKEPENSAPIGMSEDEFELVMAIFEKVTHEKTEFLHHGIEQGSSFPPFSDYQDTFASSLTLDMFARFEVPAWVPDPERMLRLSKVVYPYWRDRRIERVGHRIIPVVNLDETDTRNESYICFRRREIKAIRKTRAQQATYSDRMLRLQSELSISLELALAVHAREEHKHRATVEAQALWEKRLAFVDLKRKFPSLISKEDDDLLYDKERVPKKPKLEPRLPLKIRTQNGDFASPVTYSEPQIRPRERQAQIRSQIEQEMARMKEKNSQWEDLVDNPYQPPAVSYASRLFKIAPPTRGSLSSTDADSDQSARNPRALRMRVGRGGRMFVDRRVLSRPTVLSNIHGRSVGSDPDQASSSEDDVETQERIRRLEERWRYDVEDSPAHGPNGPDEQDRVLVDDYDPKYLAQRMLLFGELEQGGLKMDHALLLVTADGRQHSVTPSVFLPQPMMRPPPRQNPSSSSSGQGTALLSGPSTSSGASIPVATQLKKMAPPAGIQQMRISNGGMRHIGTPTLPTLPNMHAASPVLQISPQSTPPNSAGQSNGFHDTNGQTADSEDSDVKLLAHPAVNGTAQMSSDFSTADSAAVSVASTSPMRTKVQNPQPVSTPTLPNGYHINPTNAYPANITNTPYMHPAGRQHPPLTIQQMQNIKTAFNISPPPDTTVQVNAANANHAMRNQAYMNHIPNGTNYSVQLAVARQMQWAAVAAQQQQQQRIPSLNAGEAIGLDGMTAPQLSPSLPGTPARVPSANGMRGTPLQRNLAVQGNHAMGAVQGRASPANAHIARLAQPHSPMPHMLSPSLGATQTQVSPTRSPRPPLATPSPSMQSRQIVGSSGAGY